MAEAEKDDWLDDLDSPEDQASELDQSDIDALLSGSDDQGPAVAGPGPAEDETQELGQSDIDALLAGVDESAGGGLDSGDLDQSDIDALLAGPKSETREQTAIDPDQDEIDKLFSDIDSSGDGRSSAEESAFPAEEIDFKDVFDSADTATQSGLPDFDAEEFKLDADIPDIPDTTGFDLEDSDIFKDDTVVVPPPPQQPVPKSEPAPPKPPPDAPPVQAAKKPWHLLSNRKVLIGIGSGLAVLLIGAGAFLFRGAPKPATEAGAPAVVAHPPTPAEHEAKAVPAEAPPPESPPHVTQTGNGAPTVNDLDLTMPPESGQLMITLCGLDPENAPLEYEFQSMPEHGQLSGHAPNLIYTPKPGFSGPDGFTVRATDGKMYSAPALVKINRQPPLPSAQEAPAAGPAASGTPTPESAAESTEGKAKVEGIAASDRSYTVTNSKGQVISWPKIWSKSNDLPFDQEVQVDILSAPKHGTLSPSKGQQSIYRPEQAFRGTDTIRYRFKQGALVSPAKTVTLRVQPKNRAPVLALQPLATAYTAGDTVIMNASRTKDDHRDALSFQWEQLAGVPVVIRPLNHEGSQVSFVAPASFNTVSNPALLFKVTVTDQHGAQDSKELTVTTKSRRHSAVWRGRHE